MSKMQIDIARQVAIGLIVSLAAAAMLARMPTLRAWINNEPGEG